MPPPLSSYRGGSAGLYSIHLILEVREGGWPLADSMPKKVSVFQTCFLSLTLAETHSVREQVNATNNCCTEIKTTYCFFGQYETESSCGEILHALYVMYPLFCED